MKIVICSLFLVAVTLVTVAHARALLATGNVDEKHSNASPSLQVTDRTVGGEKAVIKVTAYESKVTVFVNGEQEATVESSTTEVTTKLRKNDVVAFEGEKIGNPKKVGFLATIKMARTGDTYRTGVEEFTTKVDLPKWKKWEKEEWKRVKVFKDKDTGEKLKFCHWKKARKVRIKKKLDEKAFYIWRLEGEEKKPAEEALFRFVVGGEKCGGIPKDNDKDEDEGKGRVPVPREDVYGQSDERNDGFCVCKFNEEKGGNCYDMEDATATSGKCKPRSCEARFECVAEGDKMCVKRKGKKKVVLVSTNTCEVVATDEVDMLLPYEG
ncbi:hypothetical protein FGB62_22g035 [Gracilaria domingensis]|nr:hypothetical protein FGB62_22g035 [Gracilaria domingensis]